MAKHKVNCGFEVGPFVFRHITFNVDTEHEYEGGTVSISRTDSHETIPIAIYKTRDENERETKMVMVPFGPLEADELQRQGIQVAEFNVGGDVQVFERFVAPLTLPLDAMIQKGMEDADDER